MAPRVSVGIPVYNGGQAFRESIESILNQTYHDFELILSDNASTDETEDIGRSYAENDPRVRYFRTVRNVGAPGNYNAAFNHARGTYFKWASANDLCQPEFLEECVTVLEARPEVVLCYPKTRLFDSTTGSLTDFEDNLDLEQTDPVERWITCIRGISLNNAMNGLVRSSILRRTGLVKNYHGSDLVLMAELALYGRFFMVQEYLFYRRMEPGAATSLMDVDDARTYFQPTSQRAMLFQYWRKTLEYYRVIFRAPLTVRQRSRAMLLMLRHTTWIRDKLTQDLQVAARTIGGRVVGRFRS